MPDQPEDDKVPDPKKNPWVQVARYSQLALMLPAGVVAGWLIGTALDHWLGTTWLKILCLFLGIAGGLVELIRTVVRDSK